ncbi:MAG: hypothetical protein ACRDQ5_02295, partial [Sciscionella sp.]
RCCESAGIELMVAPQRRFNPSYTSFTQLADQIGTQFMADDMGYHLIDMILWYFGLPDRVLGDMSMSAALLGARSPRLTDIEPGLWAGVSVGSLPAIAARIVVDDQDAESGHVAYRVPCHRNTVGHFGRTLSFH